MPSIFRGYNRLSALVLRNELTICFSESCIYVGYSSSAHVSKWLPHRNGHIDAVNLVLNGVETLPSGLILLVPRPVTLNVMFVLLQ